MKTNPCNDSEGGWNTTLLICSPRALSLSISFREQCLWADLLAITGQLLIDLPVTMDALGQ